MVWRQKCIRVYISQGLTYTPGLRETPFLKSFYHWEHIHLSQTQPTQTFLKALLLRDHRGFPLILQISTEQWHNASPTHQQELLCGRSGALAWWKSCINSDWIEHNYQCRSSIIYCKGQIGQGDISRNAFYLEFISEVSLTESVLGLTSYSLYISRDIQLCPWPETPAYHIWFSFWERGLKEVKAAEMSPLHQTRSDAAFSRIYYSFQAIAHCTQELINQVSPMIKINIIILSPKSERFTIGQLRKTLISKSDCCIGFSFDDNKTCAALHRGLKILLRFLGDSCCNTRDLNALRALPSSLQKYLSFSGVQAGSFSVKALKCSSSRAHREQSFANSCSIHCKFVQTELFWTYLQM